MHIASVKKGLIIRTMCKFFVNFLGPIELAKRRLIAEAKFAFKFLAFPLASGADFYMRLKMYVRCLTACPSIKMLPFKVWCISLPE